MRKLLLFIKPLLFGVVLTVGQCPSYRSPENKIDNREPVSGDTLSQAPIVMNHDSINMDNDSLITKPMKVDTMKTRRIEHGSDNAARLDSIKKAKTKKKH